jgi:hypothetical protein
MTLRIRIGLVIFVGIRILASSRPPRRRAKNLQYTISVFWLSIEQLLGVTLDKMAKTCYSSLLMIKNRPAPYILNRERDQHEITGH